MTHYRQFSTPNENMTDRIGYHFGEVFYAPLLGENAQQESLVVAAYGAMGAGKSPFSTAFLNRDETYFNEYTAVLPNRAHAPLQNGELRYNDFAATCVQNHLWQTRMPETGGLQPKAQAKIPVGIDLLEHPPLPHLMGADIVLLAARPNSERYFRELGHFFKMTARDCKPLIHAKMSENKRFFMKMSSICLSFATQRRLLDQSKKAKHHLFKVVLINETEEMKARFRKFHPNRRRTSLIPQRCHSSVSHFVAGAGMM